MVTFNVVLGNLGLLFQDFFTFFFFNPTDRPTQYQETHSTLKEKKGDGLTPDTSHYNKTRRQQKGRTSRHIDNHTS